VYEDKSYDWTLKGPPSSWYIKQATGLARGADRAGHETVGTISLKHLYEIAKVGFTEAVCPWGGIVDSSQVLLSVTVCCKNDAWGMKVGCTIVRSA
jgi:hypothetical protein